MVYLRKVQLILVKFNININKCLNGIDHNRLKEKNHSITSKDAEKNL